MTKNQSAQSGLHVVEQNPINEAIARLDHTYMALRAFRYMLGLTEDLDGRISGAHLACLIDPHIGEIGAATDELRSLGAK